MIKLSKLAEAIEAGWLAFRVTLFAPPRKSITFVGDFTPDNGQRGDMWIQMPDMSIYIHNGWYWRSLKEHKDPLWKRYLTRWKK